MTMLRSLLLGLLLALAAAPSHAAAASGSGGQCQSQESGGGQQSVITVVTECVQRAITDATWRYLSEFSDYMQPLIATFMLLIVTFFGATTLWSNDSMEERKQKAFTLLFKIGAVGLFAYNFGGWTMNAFEGSRQLQDVVVQTLPNDSKCQSEETGSSGSAYISQSGQKVWGALDCLLGRLMGYGAKIGLSSSIFGLLTAIVGSGTMGLSVGLIGVICLLSFIFFVLRVVYIFLISYLMIGFLIILSPLTIPTMLHHSTARVFEAWWKSLMVAIFMPGVVFTFLCLTMPLIDKAVGSDQDAQQSGNDEQSYRDDSLSKILGSTSKVEGAYRNPQQAFGLSTRFFDMGFVKNRSGNEFTRERVFESGNGKSITTPSRSGATDLGQSVNLPRVDFGQGTQGKLWRIGYGMIKILIVSMLLTSLMGAIPEIVSSIFGAGSALVIASTGELPFEGRIKQGFSTLAQKFTGKGR